MSLKGLSPPSNLLLTDEEFRLLSKEDQEYYLYLLKQRLKEVKAKKLLNYLPNPKQEKFHKSPSYIRTVLGGNRSGKTTCGVVEFLWHMTGHYPPWYPKEGRYNRAIKGRIMCEDFQKHGQRVIVPAIEEWLDLDLIKFKKNNPIQFPIYWELKNGSSFEILTYEQKTVQFEGWEGDLAWFDEPPPRDKFIATTRGLVDRGGRVMMTLTPLNQPWIFDEIVKVADKSYSYSLTMDIRDNLHRVEDGVEVGHLNEAAIKRFEMALKPEEKEARLHGKFLHLSGLVFKQFDPNVHIFGECEVKDTWTRYMAIDPHPRTPTACLWLAVDEFDNYVVYDELYLADMDIKEMASAIKAQEGPYPAQIRYIDPAMDKDNAIAGGFNVRKELMKYGIYTIRANNDWDYGKDCMDQALTPKWNSFTGEETPRLRIDSGCKRLIHEITHYVWDSKMVIGIENQKQRPIKKNDHMVDCLRYLLAAGPRQIFEEPDEDDGPSYKGDYSKYPVKRPSSPSKYDSLIDRRG